jgi:hypothetical protein
MGWFHVRHAPASKNDAECIEHAGLVTHDDFGSVRSGRSVPADNQSMWTWEATEQSPSVVRVRHCFYDSTALWSSTLAFALLDFD